nr:hypothetical protein [Tanacetum cinerariifolium]
MVVSVADGDYGGYREEVVKVVMSGGWWREHQSDTKACTMTMEILLEPTSNKLLVAVKLCQEDSLEFYLITSSIYIDQRGTVVIATVFDEATKTLSSISVDYR